MRALWIASLLAAVSGATSCKKRTPDGPETPRHDALLRALTPALAVAAGDLTGDSRPEIVAVDDRIIRVLDLSGSSLAEARAPSGIQFVETADIDGDGRAEILTGWGSTEKRRGGKPRLALYRMVGKELSEELLVEPQSERADVVAALPHAGAVVVAWFESKYMVRFASARRKNAAWSTSVLATLRMATSLSSGDVDGDGKPDLVVGRVYGDTIEADGDAFVLGPNSERIPIPVTGGVQSLTVADLDGDRRAEVLLGDGWNRDYGKRARGLLTKASFRDGAFTTELLDDGARQYVLHQISVADLDGDQKPEIVTRGNAFVRVLRHRDGRWIPETVGTACTLALAIELDARPGKELFTLCEDGAQIRKP